MSRPMSSPASDLASKPHSYLLRIWRTTDDRGVEIWRALLRRSGDTEPIGFPDLETLFTFLADHYRVSPPSAERTENQCFGK